MNDQAFERIIAERIAGAVVTTSSGPAIDRTVSRASRIPQRPRWLALIKEPPMRTPSGLAVGSPTTRLAAIMVTTLLLAVTAGGAVWAGTTFLAGSGAIVVAQDGSGDFETIAEALAAAVDGDTIKVMPGTYPESLVIDKDVTISGEGPREEVVLVTDGSGRIVEDEDFFDLARVVIGKAGLGSIVDDKEFFYLARISDADVTLEGLTFRGDNAGILIVGGSPTISDVLFDHIGQPYGSSGLDGDGLPLVLAGGTTALVQDSAFARTADTVIEGQSSPTLRRNSFSEGSNVYAYEPGDEAIVSKNTFSGTYQHAIGIYDPTTMLIEDNTITDAATSGIEVGWLTSDDGVDPIIHGNVITGGGTGINITRANPTVDGNIITGGGTGINITRASPTVEGNEIVGADSGISISGGTPTLRGNTVRNGTGDGIYISSGSFVSNAPTLRDNTVEGMAVGLVLTLRANPVMTGNTFCGNEINVVRTSNAGWDTLAAREQYLIGNEICPDDAPTS